MPRWAPRAARWRSCSPRASASWGPRARRSSARSSPPPGQAACASAGPTRWVSSAPSTGPPRRSASTPTCLRSPGPWASPVSRVRSAPASRRWRRSRGLGFGYFVSTGNTADITPVEVLREMLEDDRIKVLAGYLEGLADGAASDRARVGGARSRQAAGHHQGRAQPGGRQGRRLAHRLAGRRGRRIRLGRAPGRHHPRAQRGAHAGRAVRPRLQPRSRAATGSPSSPSRAAPAC